MPYYLGLDARDGQLKGCLLTDASPRTLELGFAGGLAQLERFLETLDQPVHLSYCYDQREPLLPLLNRSGHGSCRIPHWRVGAILREAWEMAGRSYDRAHLLAWMALRARTLGYEDQFVSPCRLAREWLGARQEDVLRHLR